MNKNNKFETTTKFIYEYGLMNKLWNKVEI